MKLLFGSIVFALLVAPAMRAQAPAATPVPLPAEAKANPFVWSANQMYMRSEKNILAAADEMPADKYTYHPTEGQRSFAWIVSHLANSNGALCAGLSGNPAPPTVKVPETASKDELVAGLKASFAFCDTTMGALTDAKLTETVSFMRGAQVPRARVLFEIVGDLMDHYSQMAGYLRGAGMLPPSATAGRPAGAPAAKP